MSQEQWSAIDHYIGDSLLTEDPVLSEALTASDAAGLPSIAVAPNQGKLLQLLARSIGARKILEIGTLGGYSTIWLGRALSAQGKLISLELDEKHAQVARANLSRAELSSIAEVRVGRAIELLPKLANEAPFDLTFIDADKASLADYFSWALKLSRPGSLIIVDNVIRKGLVLDANSTDANVQGVRRLNELLKREPRVSATALQTVGSKGHDGLLFALVLS